MHVRNKLIIGIAILFFLSVNTVGLWADNVGFYAMLFPILLFLTFVVLSVILLAQIFFSIRKGFKEKERNILVGVLTSVIFLTFLTPTKFANFTKSESKDILVAQREGVANCTTTLKLKENQKFTSSDICFGTSKLAEIILFQAIR